jgi:hypothetical protein
MTKEENKKEGVSTDDIDLRLVSDSEAKTMSQNFYKMAIAIQTTLNVFQRQVMHNLGLRALHKEASSGSSYQGLTSGISSRFAYNALVTYPTLHIRKILEQQDASKFQINFVSAGIDTAIGVPLELNGSIKTMQSLGVDVKKADLMKMTSRSFFPFAIRNGLVWSQINADSKSLPTDIVTAGVSGALSSPFHNIGMKMAESAATEKTVFEAMNKVKNDFIQNPNLLRAGAPSRTIATMAAKFFLSPKTTEFIKETIEDIFEGGKDTPSNSPSPEKNVVKTIGSGTVR